ncbi:MAG: hypothetical protein MJA29_01730 [Candidatus Omnitrophica bacterium]|nr:hypothetical protein [Candidatus Omnitrophota bacterium]
MEQDIFVTGIGYYLRGQAGCRYNAPVFSGSGAREIAKKLYSKGLVPAQPANFGRFDRATLSAYLAAVLSVHDAGMVPGERKRHTGIIGSSAEGALEANRAFFGDYLSAGRKTARANLFVYTLPTTPLAECALALGLTGPLLFLQYEEELLGRLLEQAAMMIADARAQGMLALYCAADAAVCFYLCGEPAGARLSLAGILSRLQGKENMTIREMISAAVDRA